MRIRHALIGLLTVRHDLAGRVSLTAIVQHVSTELRGRCGTSFALKFDNGILTADTADPRQRGVDPDSLGGVIAAATRTLPGIAKVFTPATLATAPVNDEDVTRWQRNLPPEIGWLMLAVAKPGYVFSDKMTGAHGTMLPETVRIPIAFMGNGIQAGTFPRLVRSVDVAPTLARLIGVQPSDTLDGAALDDVFARY